MNDSEDKPTSIGLPEPERNGVLELARRARGRAARGIRLIVTDPRLRDAASRALVRLDEALADRENLEKIQSVLAGAGNFAMKRSFALSPEAKLLFEYAEWCEHTRSRREVARSVFRDGIRIPLELLAVVERSVRHDVTREELEKQRAKMLDLLWYMASDRAMPRDHLDEALEREGIPERFRDLFDRARGMKVERGVPESERRELTRRSDVFRDPGIRFMMRALPIFLQSYLLKLAIETLPEIADW